MIHTGSRPDRIRHTQNLLRDIAWPFDVFGMIYDRCEIDTSREVSIAAIGKDWETVGQGLRNAMLGFETEHDLDVLGSFEDEAHVTESIGAA